MTVNAITGTKKGRTGIAPTYLHTAQSSFVVTAFGGGRSGQCYIILREVGWHNCYITLHGEGRC